MTSSEERFVGIDVGKKKNDVHVHGVAEDWEYHNDAEGIGRLVDAMAGLAPTLIVVPVGLPLRSSRM